jgi:membrane fusion protein (multidrug efflux system)
MRSTTIFSSTLALFALTALLAGCGQSPPAAAGPPAAGDPEVAVVTIAPRPVTLSTVLPGRTSAYLVADVRPQVSGIVQKRLFSEGADVKEGEVLYQIDPATYQAAYDNAQAALAKAEANAQPARLKAERYATLIKANVVSRQDNDDAQAAHGQAVAEVTAAKAALESARINLSYTRVTAPVAGRIGKSTVTPGALVTASQPAALSTVQQIDPIYVDVTQSSADLLRLKRELASGRLTKTGADSARVKLLYEDGSAYPLEGVLQFSDITVDPSTGVITLRAVFPNPAHDLLPGLFVRAVLEEGVDERAILAPQLAVTRDSKGAPLVMVVGQGEVVESRSIEVGRVVGEDWLVTSGLAPGERVIVEGLQKIRPGAKVKAQEAAAQAEKPVAALDGPSPDQHAARQ